MAFRDPFGLMDVRYTNEESKNYVNSLRENSPKFDKAMKGLEDDKSILVIIGIGNTAETSCGAIRRTGGCTSLMLNPRAGYQREVRIALDPEGLREDVAASPDIYFDMQTVVAHEVYGHAVPYRKGGICDDAGVMPCSVKRENTIREDAGLPRRPRY